MNGITKVLKKLREQADDIVEYTKNMNELNDYVSVANTACYSCFHFNYSVCIFYSFVFHGVLTKT